MVINPIVGVYIPIIRIPIKGGMTIPNIATFDHGTYVDGLKKVLKMLLDALRRKVYRMNTIIVTTFSKKSSDCLIEI